MFVDFELRDGNGCLTRAVFVLDILQLIKKLHALGFFIRKDNGPFHLVFTDDEHIHLVPFPDRDVSGWVAEFGGGDLPFGFKVHVNQNVVVVHADNFALNYGAFFQITEVRTQIVFKRACKVKVVFMFHARCHTHISPADKISRYL